jgi:hypothetical protein
VQSHSIGRTGTDLSTQSQKVVILSGYGPRNMMLSADRISLRVLSPAISYYQGSLAGSNQN